MVSSALSSVLRSVEGTRLSREIGYPYSSIYIVLDAPVTDYYVCGVENTVCLDAQFSRRHGEASSPAITIDSGIPSGSAPIAMATPLPLCSFSDGSWSQECFRCLAPFFGEANIRRGIDGGAGGMN